MELDAFKNVEALALGAVNGFKAFDCPDIDEVFDNTTKTIVRLLGAGLCTIRLLGDDDLLQLKSAEGKLKDLVYPGDIKLQEDCMGMAVLKNQDMVFHNLEGLKKTLYSDSLLKSGLSRHVAFLTVKVSGKSAGVVTICSAEEISEEDMELVNSLMGLVASAMEKDALRKEIKKLYFNAVKTLVKTIEAKDIYTKGHSVRVSKYASSIARKLGFSDTEVEEAEVTGILHDIGKIGVNDIILTKPEGLNKTEFQVIKQHPFLGSKILEPIGFSENIINGTLLHHKRYDLKGYPNDVKLMELPMMPRIIGAADAFDAMTSIRPYKTPMHKREAIAEMKNHIGTQFCPQVVGVMEQLYAENML